ncbi:restriction endonuclease subunit S [Aeromonas veronii]
MTALEDIAEPSAPIRYGVVQIGEDTKDGIPIVPIKFIDTIATSPLHRASKDIEGKYANSRVQGGDVLISVKGTIGAIGIVPDGFSGNIAREIARIRPSDKYDSAFIALQLQAEKTQREIDNLTVGTTRREFSIHAVRKFSIYVPPLPEQKKIAKIFSTWDKAITTTEQLLANSQQQKKALMQQLLTGQKRLLDKNGVRFSGEWKTYKFGSLFNERVETGRDDLPLLSITADDGVVYQEDTGRKNTSNEDKSKYRRICVNDIGYNTMRMWQGRSSLSDKEGIVSPAYTIVTPTGKVCPAYAAYLFKFPALVHIFYRHSQGLVSDTWNLKFNHFKKISWQVPSIDEQQKIAAVLSTADKEVTAQQQKLDALKQEKKALMQQLLTGKRRVKIDDKEVA